MKRKRNKHGLQHGRRHRQLSLMPACATAAAPTFCQTARNISCFFFFGFLALRKTCQRHPLSVQGGSPCVCVRVIGKVCLCE